MYVNDAQLLPEGEEKHIISVFVADESGIINRVAGVFARRGALPPFKFQCHFAGVVCLTWPCRSPPMNNKASLSKMLKDHCDAGANIDSLAVGLNLDKALFTIVVTGTTHTVVSITGSEQLMPAFDVLPFKGFAFGKRAYTVASYDVKCHDWQIVSCDVLA